MTDEQIGDQLIQFIAKHRLCFAVCEGLISWNANSAEQLGAAAREAATTRCACGTPAESRCDNCNAPVCDEHKRFDSAHEAQLCEACAKEFLSEKSNV